MHHVWLRTFIPQQNLFDFQVDERQFIQDPDTIDEPDFFSNHIPTNTPCQEQQSDEEIDHDMETPN